VPTYKLPNFNKLSDDEKLKDKGTGVVVRVPGSRGRCMDNIFIERLWRSLKYEEVYLKDYRSVTEARAGIEKYLRFCNQERLHQSLDYRTPAGLYLARG
jgi:putative transposase